MKMILVGQAIYLGWNGSKYFNEHLAYSEVRVEATGADWVVIRDTDGRASAAAFPQGTGHAKMLQMLTS
jgi:hypothetical protein